MNPDWKGANAMLKTLAPACAGIVVVLLGLSGSSPVGPGAEVELAAAGQDREFVQARSPSVYDDAGTVRIMIDYARKRFEYVRKLNREIARLETEWPDFESDLIQ